LPPPWHRAQVTAPNARKPAARPSGRARTAGKPIAAGMSASSWPDANPVRLAPLLADELLRGAAQAALRVGRRGGAEAHTYIHAAHRHRIAGDCAGARGRCLRQQLWRRQRRRGLSLRQPDPVGAERGRSPEHREQDAQLQKIPRGTPPWAGPPTQTILLSPWSGNRCRHSTASHEPADQLGMMHPDEETPAVGGGRGWVLRPDVGGCPDTSTLPEDG
jgi:hypothetical protein